jgi:hypothetical protein
MDKLKNIRIIKAYFSHCFNEEVDVLFDVDENYYKVGDSDYKLEDGEFKYIIFPLHEKFLRWAWSTDIEVDFVEGEYIYNDFHSCLEAIMIFQLNLNLENVSKMRMFGLFEDDYDDKNPFGE